MNLPNSNITFLTKEEVLLIHKECIEKCVTGEYGFDDIVKVITDNAI